MKKKNFFIFSMILAIAFVLSGCNYFSKTSLDKQSSPIDGSVGQEETTMFTEEEARVIAESTCIKDGEALTSGGTYNENSKTWWFDANLKSAQEGCNPACVVSEETKTAEINWRCTGLIAPDEEMDEAILGLFKEKYPEYSETLSINIERKTADHVRGSVSFEPGVPGGLFLATKVDGDWQVVHEGNGEISCDLSKYGFPNDMLLDCAEQQ